LQASQKMTVVGKKAEEASLNQNRHALKALERNQDLNGDCETNSFGEKHRSLDHECLQLNKQLNDKSNESSQAKVHSLFTAGAIAAFQK